MAGLWRVWTLFGFGSLWTAPEGFGELVPDVHAMLAVQRRLLKGANHPTQGPQNSLRELRESPKSALRSWHQCCRRGSQTENTCTSPLLTSAVKFAKITKHQDKTNRTVSEVRPYSRLKKCSFRCPQLDQPSYWRKGFSQAGCLNRQAICQALRPS